jgi:hypothetical protein
MLLSSPLPGASGHFLDCATDVLLECAKKRSRITPEGTRLRLPCPQGSRNMFSGCPNTVATPREKFLWFSLVFIDFPWFSLVFRGFHWFSVVFRGFPWFSLVFLSFSLVFLGLPLFSLVFIGFPLAFLGFPWVPLVFLSFSLVFLGFPWFSLVFFVFLCFHKFFLSFS